MKCLHTEKWRATAAYTMVQFVTWCFYAIIMTFSSNVLHEFGFSDSQISLLLAIATGSAFVLQVGIAELIGRCEKISVWAVLVILGLLMILGNVVILVPGMPVWVAIGAFGSACMILQIIPPLANAMGMDAIKRGSSTSYSVARGMGSLGYCLLAYVTGLAVSARGIRTVPVITIICASILVTAVICFHLVVERKLETPALAPAAEQKKQRGFLRQYPRFALFLAASVLLQLSHNLLCNFMYQIMLIKQGGAAEQGTANAICAFVEIPVMILFPLMMRKLRCDKWVRFSAMFVVIKSVGFLLASTPIGIYAIQTTQMLGYGLYTISSVNYAEMVVAPGESVRAQSYLGATSTVGILLAVGMGGVICDYFGAQIMILVSAIFGLLGGLIIALTAQKTKQ